MKLQQNIDFNGLGWIKREIDVTLKQAQEALEGYVDDSADTGLMRFCASYLHQVQGALRMVELYGAAMVADEMELLAQALVDGRIGDPEDAYGVLMRGIVQLPNYLERVQEGHKDIPVVLLPLLNDLRACRGEKLLSESVLFSTGRMEEPTQALAEESPPAPVTVDQSVRAHRLRNAYELALLRWFKASSSNECQDRLIAILDRLFELSFQPEARSLWWVGTAVMEAIRDGDLEASVTVKLLFGQIDRQLKRFVEDGEEELAGKPPRELMQSLLYYIAHSTASGQRVTDVRRIYHLQNALPTDGELQQAEGAMAGHNRTLLNTVSGAIKDDLLRVKELLDVFLRTRDADPSMLLEPAEVLDRVGDTLGMLGLGVPRKLIEAQRQLIEDMGSGRGSVDETRLLEVAKALLVVETSLDDQIGRLGGQTEVALPLPGELELPKAEVRKILDALMREAASNVQQVKLDIVAFIESPWDHARVEPIPRLLEEIAGALNMLDLGDAAEAMTGILRFVDTELLGKKVVPSAGQMDHLADALASIEYYLDATREQRAGREGILTVTQRALESLGYWPVPAAADDGAAARRNDGDEPPVRRQPSHELLEVAPVPGWLGSIDTPNLAPDLGLRSEPMAAPPSRTFNQFGFIDNSADGIDQDIRDVFLEEVGDEVQGLKDALPGWLDDPENRGLLTPIRRSFHTMKGSGRLVGASAIAEFSWKIESLLNRILDGSTLPGLEVQAVVKDAVGMLPSLLEGLRSGIAPLVDIDDVMLRAQELTKAEPGRSYVSAAVASSGADADEASDNRELPDEAAAPEIDSALLEILTTEVAMHVDAIDRYLAECEQQSVPATEEFLRAVHTLNGAIAMVDVPGLANVLGPLEGYVRRLRAANAAPDPTGLMALHRAADLVRQVSTRLGTSEPLPSEPAGLAWRLGNLRDALPDPASAPREEVDSDDAVVALDVLDEGISIDFSSEFDDDELESLLAVGDDSQTMGATPEQLFGSAPPAASSLDLTHGDVTTSPSKLAAADQDDWVDDPQPSGRLELADIDDDLLEVFLQEAAELLDHCDGLMTGVRSEVDVSEHLTGLQRDLHTLKGGARMSGLPPIGDVGHAMESLLEAVQEDGRILDREAVEALQRGFDVLHEMVQRVNQRQAIGLPVRTLARLDRWVSGELPAMPAPAQPERGDDSSMAVVPEHLDLVDEVDTAEVVPVVATSTPSIGELIDELAGKSSPIEPATLDLPIEQVEPYPAVSSLPTPSTLITPAVLSSAPPVSAVIVPIKPSLPPITEPPPAALVEEIATAKPIETPAPLPQLDEAPRAAQEMIRVRSDLLDSLVNFAGEVSIYRSRLDQQNSSFRFNLVEFDQTINRLREQLRKFEIETEAQIVARFQREHEGEDKPVFDPLELDRFSQLQQYSRSLAESVSDLVSIQNLLEELTRQSEALLLAQSRVSSELQDGLMRTRMVPFDSLVPTLRRTLRQAAQDVGKRAQLKVEGAQGEMDRTLLERMKAPFEHMLRNALAHAIEAPEERVQAGKPDEGTVTIAVSRDSTEVVLRVSDDGRGLDAAAIRRRAIERGLLREDQNFADRDVYPFILESGFSTSTQVTKLAGRGVGMDVVHNEIKQLGGSLAIDSVVGQGTTFTIRLPFTLAVTQAIVVKLGNATYAIPMTSVQGVSRIEREDLQGRIANGTPHFSYAGDDYDIYDLANLLDIPPERAPDDLQLPLLMTRTGDQRAAVRVDSVAGSREVVVKSVGPQISSVPGIFGATIMGDGSVVMILDLAPLVRRAAAKRSLMEAAAIVESLQLREGTADDSATRMPLVMVVDDSITMRKVTQRVLERADMEVITAKDGIDAVEKLQERTPDLMLLDIEMPRMDGYELASYMKNDSRLRPVPIMMITSRSGEKHRQRAMEIGVERYLGKPYQEADLLRQVQEVLETRRG